MQSKLLVNLVLLVSLMFMGPVSALAGSDSSVAQKGIHAAPNALPAFAKIVAGESHACALTSGGGVKCWGANQDGQLGDGTTEGRNAPLDVSGLNSGITSIAAGALHTCALTGSGGVKCWGANREGQLGNGLTDDSTTPVDVFGLDSGVAALLAGGYHTCGLMTGGGVKCWGDQRDGQSDHTPVDISGLGTVVALALGEYHTCALMTNGAVKCWGANRNGQLGDGTTEDRSTPVAVNGLSGVVALSAGGDQTCALTAGSGSAYGVKCWGKNGYGQLGDGSFNGHNLPADVSGLTGGATAVAAGQYHTCALVAGGRPKCWGWNGSGQLGLGTQVQSLTPVDVVESVSPRISLNYAAGQPNSYFTVTGENFPPSSPLSVSVNGRRSATALQTNETGGFIFFLNTAAADEGAYVVTASVNPSASATFLLRADQPSRAQEGGGATLDVPAGAGSPLLPVYLPGIRR